MGDAAGKLADGLDLLQLAQAPFAIRAQLHLAEQAGVGLLQRLRAFGDDGLKALIETLEGGFVAVALPCPLAQIAGAEQQGFWRELGQQPQQQ